MVFISKGQSYMIKVKFIKPKILSDLETSCLVKCYGGLAWFEVKVVDQYSVAKTSLVVHASSLQTEYGEKIGQECTLAPDCQLISLWEK